MRKTKAAFRAMREKCGMSQQDVADEADVSVESVKRWENPRYPGDPPDDVWDWLLDAVAALELDASEMAEQARACAGDGHRIVLDYFRTQEQLDAVQLPDADEPVGYRNARTRMIADIIQADGIDVIFEYPS